MADPLSLSFLLPLLGGSAVNAGSSLLGGLLGQTPGVSLGNMPVAGGVDANANPLYNSLLQDLLGQLGAGSAGTETASSPTQILRQAFLGSGGVKVEHDDRLQGALRGLQQLLDAAPDLSPESLAKIEQRMRQVIDPANLVQLDKALTVSGYQTLGNLLTQEAKFRTDLKQSTADREALAPITRQGRIDAAKKIAELQSNFPIYSKEDIQRLSDVDRQKQSESLLQAANVGGFNPGAGLSEIQRNVGPEGRAIALLGGAQGLDVNALAALYSSLAGPTSAGTSLAQVGLNTALQNMSLGAQQAATYTQANQNANLNNATNTGNSVVAAGNALGGGLSSLAFADMLQKQPGTNPNAGNQNKSALEDWLGTGNIWG